MTSKKQIIRELSKAVRATGAKKFKGYFGVLGDKSGTVLTGVGNLVYVTTFEGQTRTVINRKVPNRAGTVVAVGTDEYSANKIEVLYALNVTGITNDGVGFTWELVPLHSHSYDSLNPAWITPDLFLTLLTLPYSGVVVQVFPGPFLTTAGEIKWFAGGTVDMSSYFPGSDALWAILQIDDDATISVEVGSTAARESLTTADIPPATTGKRIVAITLEAGYDKLFRNNARNDFFDLRFFALDTNAANVIYTPLDPNDWDYLADPGHVKDALDQLADRAASLENLFPIDAANVTYTPEVLADWDYLEDPGNADSALDQLAERTADLEATPPGSWDGNIADVDTTSGSEIGAALENTDRVLGDDDSSGNPVWILMSRIWTYIESKLQAVTDLSSYSWLLDEDDMSSDDATKVASQQSVKAYVDARKVEFPFIQYIADSGAANILQPFSANGAKFIFVVGNDINIDSFLVGTNIQSGNNDGSHYWTVAAKRLSDGSTIASFNTSVDGTTPTGWVRHEDASPSITSLAAADEGAYVELTKTGSPGNIFIGSPLFSGSFQ